MSLALRLLIGFAGSGAAICFAMALWGERDPSTHPVQWTDDLCLVFVLALNVAGWIVAVVNP